MKIAVITGASSGMGREFVKIIAKEKRVDEIWLIARRRSRLEALKKHFPGQKFRLLCLDLCKKEDLSSLEDLLREEAPSVQYLIHSAGVGVMGTIEEIPREQAENMVACNCTSVTAVTSLLLPFLTEDASMIYMVSAAAFLPQPGFSVYAATKAFALSYVRSLRAEQHALVSGKHRKITAVCPGSVKTEFLQGLGKEIPWYKKLVIAEPKKVAALAWKDNQKGKEMSVYGWTIRATYAAAKLIPHAWILKILS